MIRSLLLTILLLIVIVFLITCLIKIKGNHIILEFESVRDFKLVEHPGCPKVVTLSGYSGQSAWSVSRIETKIVQSSMVIYIYLTLGGGGEQKLTGDFKYDIVVPDIVNEIKFGEKGYVIWRCRT